MKYKTLLLEPRRNILDAELQELTSRGLAVIGATCFEEALRLLAEDGSIHVILTEWEIPRSDKLRTDAVKGPDLFRKFLEVRYEVNIFLFTSEKNARTFATGGIVNGYFYKGDRDYDDIVRKVKAEVVNSKNRAPFFEKLVEYANKAKDSWHTPGHASSYSVKNSPAVRDYYEFFGEISSGPRETPITRCMHSRRRPCSGLSWTPS